MKAGVEAGCPQSLFPLSRQVSHSQTLLYRTATKSQRSSSLCLPSTVLNPKHSWGSSSGPHACITSMYCHPSRTQGSAWCFFPFKFTNKSELNFELDATVWLKFILCGRVCIWTSQSISIPLKFALAKSDVAPGVVVHSFDSSTHRQADFCELEASLAYKASSRTTKDVT